MFLVESISILFCLLLLCLFLYFWRFCWQILLMNGRYLWDQKINERNQHIKRINNTKQKIPILSCQDFCFGRGRRTWTLGTRFWTPLLYQLSYTPMIQMLFTRKIFYYNTEHINCQVYFFIFSGQPHEKISDICAKLPVFLLMI